MAYLVALLLGGTANAASPILESLKPRGAQSGTAFVLVLKGEGLSGGAEVITSIPGSLSRLAPRQESSAPGTELPFLVQLQQNAPVGAYPIRVRTDEGLSNLLLFSVGKFPEVTESESQPENLSEAASGSHGNDSFSTAQRVKVPVTINGTLRGPDNDYYRFSARAQERLVFEVEARRLGSAIDPIIRVLDPGGRELARNDDAPGLGVDARVEVEFPRTGDYYVLVHDAKYSTQEQNFYRLKIGAYPYAEGMFPLGWRRGGKVEVMLFGGNLKSPFKVMPSLAVAASQQFVPVSLPDSASLPFLFEVSDLPEILELAPSASQPGTRPVSLAPSTVVNGRLAHPGDIREYRLAVSTGEHWVISLEAADLGVSPLLGRLTVSDAETHKVLAVAGDKDIKEEYSVVNRNEPDPHLSFVVPERVKEVIVSLKDVLSRGGPNYSYRLIARRQAYDFSVEILSPFVNVPAEGTAAIEVGIRRRGYKGPIRLTIPDLPKDVSVAGGNVVAEEPTEPAFGSPTYLTLTAAPGAKPRAFELSVWGEAASGETAFRAPGVVPGLDGMLSGEESERFVALWLGRSLPVAITKASPERLEIPALHWKFPQGAEIDIPWKLVESPQLASPIDVNIRGTYSCGVVTFVRDLHVFSLRGGPEHPNEGKFHFKSGVNTPAVTVDFVIDASIKSGDKVQRIATSPAFTLEILPRASPGSWKGP